MSYNVLYNKDQYTDLVFLLTYIDEFTAGIGETSVEVDPDVCASVLTMMRNDFPHVDGIDRASAFKKMAYFMTFFIGERPMIQPKFSVNNVSPEIFKISNHANAMVALQIAIDSLEGAEIIREDGSKKVLKGRIQLSEHSYIDMIDALNNISPVNHYKILAVLLEQLAYKTNSDCQYTVIDL